MKLFEPTRAWIFFDGECALCSWCVRLLIRLDHKMIHRYSEMQSIDYVIFMKSKGLPLLDNNSVIWVAKNANESNYHVCSKSDAIIVALYCTGRFGKWMAYVLRLCPKLVRDFVYILIAKARYLLGKSRSNVVPEALRLKMYAT